jgi:5'-3' exonuclease
MKDTLDVNEDEIFDSNCITPGTAFMHNMDINLRKYIEKRSLTDPVWKNLVSCHV